jgi:hypothetical protein
MKTRTRMTVIGLILVAMLLLATGSAAARPKETPFEVIAYICEIGPPAQEWVSDGTVLHQRGVVIHSIMVSDEPRMNGHLVDVLHQDLDTITGDGRIWGRGTYVTELGVWHGVWKGAYTNFAITTHAIAQGSHGLAGQAFYWDGQDIPVPEGDPCPNGALQALYATGAITDHKGP